MATTKVVNGDKHAGPSARDLTPYQWRAAKFVGNDASSSDTAKLERDQEIDVAGADDRVVGIIEYPGDKKGKPTTIITSGQPKVKIGFAGVAGDKIKAGVNGVAAKAGAGDEYFGTLLEGAPAGAIAPFTFDRGTF